MTGRAIVKSECQHRHCDHNAVYFHSLDGSSLWADLQFPSLLHHEDEVLVVVDRSADATVVVYKFFFSHLMRKINNKLIDKKVTLNGREKFCLLYERWITSLTCIHPHDQ